MTKALYSNALFDSTIEYAKSAGLSVYLIFVSTRPCYVKLASVIRACSRRQLPFLALETGQHYDESLTSPARELGVDHLISGNLGVSRESLCAKACSFHESLEQLHGMLESRGVCGIPVVSGDTIAAGVVPMAWYLLTGVPAVHIEAGLRSKRPLINWSSVDALTQQREAAWEMVPDRPFPEARCSRSATACSSMLFAPIEANRDILLSEGHLESSIFTVGSLSADAVRSALAHNVAGALTPGRGAGSPTFRVDFHRRENLKRCRLSVLFDACERLSYEGISILLVLTHTMKGFEGAAWDKRDLDRLEKAGVLIADGPASYTSLIRFLRSDSCYAIYTDSGGLQEECAILGVPCLTCRFETDRPETVSFYQTNVLVPPSSSDFVVEAITAVADDRFLKSLLPGIQRPFSYYGKDVGEQISDVLSRTTQLDGEVLRV
jgi:UDP-N-acetylglucosamine 2-epimerase (non-hydrolysing)